MGPRFTLNHSLGSLGWLVLQPLEYWGLQVCTTTSGFCWLFYYFVTEGLTAWIRLLSNSQSYFSLPSVGITDVYYYTSLIISLRGMKEIGFHIILAGAIQERGAKSIMWQVRFWSRVWPFRFFLTVQGGVRHMEEPGWTPKVPLIRNPT